MSLQHDCTDRNYLYGRLLAIADLVEEATFKPGEERETNAMRYMNAFSRRPFRTWQIIEEKLPPYLSKLPKGMRVYFKKLLNDIQALFTPETFADGSQLDGLYLLGYHSQVNEHYSKKKDKNENKQNNSEYEDEDNEGKDNKDDNDDDEENNDNQGGYE
jgi:CRISPR-associated protein Csd1